MQWLGMAEMMSLEDIDSTQHMSDLSVLENSTVHRYSSSADRRVRWFDLNLAKAA